MRDDNIGCAKLRCTPHDNGSRRVYWCCYGCDELDCKHRCGNDRDKCNVATNTNNIAKAKIEPIDTVVAYDLWRTGKINKTEAARRCGMSQSGFWSYAKRRQQRDE